MIYIVLVFEKNINVIPGKVSVMIRGLSILIFVCGTSSRIVVPPERSNVLLKI